MSVLIPAFNAERYVRLAVESVLHQTLRDIEVIVIDDGSTDGTLSVLRSLAQDDRRVRLFSRPNTGYTVALNEAIALAQGQFLARMDADDESFPGRLAAQLSYMTRHPGCVATGTWVVRVDEDGSLLSLLDRPLAHRDIDALHLAGYGGAIVHPTALFRSSAVRRIGGYRPEFEPAEDLDIFLRLAEVGELANLPRVGLAYRVSVGSVSFMRRRQQYEKSMQAVADALGRRGYVSLEARLPWRRAPSSGMFTVVLEALRSGEFRTAIKHFRRVARREPATVLRPAAAMRLLKATCAGLRAPAIQGRLQSLGLRA